MEGFQIGLFIVAALIIAAFLLHLWPRRRTRLDQAKLQSFFMGLGLFGKDGAYVYIAGPQAQRITVKKRVKANGKFGYDIFVESPLVSTDLWDESIKPKALILDKQVSLELAKNSDGLIILELSGPRVTDPNILEGVARIVTKAIGLEDGTKVRVDFEGPKDYRAVNRYFGFSNDDG